MLVPPNVLLLLLLLVAKMYERISTNTIDRENIEIISDVKYLGVVIYKNLSFSSQVDYILK